MTTLDFNNAGEQRSFDVIDDNTICVLQIAIRPGGAGDGGWLTPASTTKGASLNLNCELTVVDGPHARRKLWARLTVEGGNHAEAKKISEQTVRAILESASGFTPKDKSEEAQRARTIQGWGDLDQVRFMARLGVEPPSNGYPAKNVIKEIITPDRKEWKKLDQVDRTSFGQSVAAAPSQAPPLAPANAIKRPDWADKK
jgi:hypothetical protein